MYIYSVKEIPLHNFSKDDESSVAFDIIPLESKSAYDSSVPHRHNYYEIFVFEKGGGEHDIDFNTFEVRDNSIHFVSPGQVHNLRRKKGSFGYAILFSRDFYFFNIQNQEILFELPFLNNNSTDSILNLSKENYRSFKELALKMTFEHQSNSHWKNDLIRSFLNAFLIYSRRYFKGNAFRTNAQNTVVFRFRKLVEQNFHQLHKVSEYADLMNISEKQLNSYIKDQLGLSPSDLIFERITLEAKRLVLYSDHTFQEIAYFLNFSDPSHFTKFFKAKTSFSPTSYRQHGK